MKGLGRLFWAIWLVIALLLAQSGTFAAAQSRAINTKGLFDKPPAITDREARAKWEVARQKRWEAFAAKGEEVRGIEAEARLIEIALLGVALDSGLGSLPTGDHFSFLDATEDPFVRQVLKDAIDDLEVARQVGFADWVLVEKPSLADVIETLYILETPLQGRLELGLFVDDVWFGKEGEKIRAAYPDRKTIELPSAGLLDDYLGGLSGNTLLTLGHIRGGSYVMNLPDGREQSLSIDDLQAKAQANNVLLIALGCKSAGANVPLGFVDIIETPEIVVFLTSLADLPRDQVTFAALIEGMRKIGPMVFNLRDAANLFAFELRLKPSGDEYNESFVRFENPWRWAPLDAQNPDLAYLESKADALRPLWQRNLVVATIRSPFTWMFVAAAACFAAFQAAERLKSSTWIFRKRRRHKLVPVLRFLGWICLAGAVICGYAGIAVTWPFIAVMILVVFVALGILMVMGAIANLTKGSTDG